MVRLWKTFVLVVALAAIACAARRPLRYEDVVEQAIEAYNKGQQGKPLFRLLDATPPSSLYPSTNIPLEFRIKETVCISSRERQPQFCNFLEDGEERNCTGEFARRRQSTFLTLTCDRECSTEGDRLNSAAADGVATVSEKDEFKDLPPNIRNIYENAKYDINTNILRNF